jgi:HEPN domain-containing protein
MDMEGGMRKNKFKTSEEWFRQAEYDLGTAEAMFDAGRYIYTVFMCHLSIEKALKGLYAKKFKRTRQRYII